MPLRVLAELRGHPGSGHHVVELPSLPVDLARIGAAEPHRALDEGFQHGLEIEGRAADDLEDLARGGLLLEGLGQIEVPGLELMEQANVLDGNGTLIGEGRDQGDLLLGEGRDLLPPDREHADRDALSQHRDAQDGPVASQPRSLVRVAGIGQHVRNVDCATL